MFDTGADTGEVDDLAELTALLDRMAATPLDRTDPGLAGQALAVCRQLSRFEGVCLRLLEAADRTGAAQVDGAVSTAAWLHATTDMTFTAARQRLRTGRVLADTLPQTAAELTAGNLSADQVHLVARAVDLTDVTRTAAGQQEAALLDIVRPVPVRSLPAVLARWQHTVDPEGSDRGEDDRHHSRWMTASPTWKGMVSINGMLDAAGGAAVLAALEAGSGLSGADDNRPKKIRRADALADLCRQALDAGGLPEVGGERPHITVTIDLHTLTGTGGKPAMLEGVGPITPELARQLACDAGVSRIITAGTSEILDVGRKTRTISSALRRALNLRDGGCVFHGCDRPAKWCQGHHLQFWSHGGPTSLDNLALLCSFHHHLVHRDGWTITRHNGRWITHRPDPAAPPPPHRQHRQRPRPRTHPQPDHNPDATAAHTTLTRARLDHPTSDA